LPHDQPPPALVALDGVAGDVVVDLGLQGLGQHPPGALPHELVDQGHATRLAAVIGVGSSRNYGELAALGGLGQCRPIGRRPKMGAGRTLDVGVCRRDQGLRALLGLGKLLVVTGPGCARTGSPCSSRTRPRA